MSDIQLAVLQELLQSEPREPETWRRIVRIGNDILRYAPWLTAAAQGLLSAHLKTWPKELHRDCPPTWPPSWRGVAEHKIRETKTYGYFAAQICSDERLRLEDGSQAVRLERRQVTSALARDGSGHIRVGQEGEADLSGSLAFDLPGGRVAIPLAVEIKGPRTRVAEAQLKRAEALRQRGEIAIFARTVEDAVSQLLAERARIRKLLISE